MTSIKLEAVAVCALTVFGLMSSSIGTQAQVATSTVSLTCSSTKKLQAAINSATAGVVTTIKVSGTCNENIVIPAGKTIVIIGVTSTTSITAANATLPALISRGDTTIQSMTISNSSGTAEALVETDKGGNLQVIASDLSAPNVDSIVGAWLGTTYIINSRVVGGKYNAFDTFGSSTLVLKGDPSFQAGPTSRFETYVKSANTGIRCNQGGSVRLKANKSGSAVGFVTIEQSQYGISGERCELEIANATGSASNIQVRNNSVDGIFLQQSDASIGSAVISNNSDNGILLQQSHASIGSAVIKDSSNNGVFLEDSSIHLTQTTVSNSGACGLNLSRSTGKLGTSSITYSGITQSWAAGICASGSDVEISGGMVLSNNVGRDVQTGLGGAVVLQSWDGPSSFPDFASVNSLECWTAYNHIYVFPGATTQDLTTVYANSSCVSFEG